MWPFPFPFLFCFFKCFYLPTSFQMKTFSCGFKFVSSQDGHCHDESSRSPSNSFLRLWTERISVVAGGNRSHRRFQPDFRHAIPISKRTNPVECSYPRFSFSSPNHEVRKAYSESFPRMSIPGWGLWTAGGWSVNRRWWWTSRTPPPSK